MTWRQAWADAGKVFDSAAFFPDRVIEALYLWWRRPRDP